MFKRIIKIANVSLIIIFFMVNLTSCSFKTKKEPKNKEDAVFTFRI
ncbi:hypothetical protein CLHOM_17870 [Clostridium homopropionicum DSM 5847]|uniref:Uncharacterized protein n=1 Tax=Clostridium homopropionicum DSM 5847 TaxID=1121318 RepID=A0A0L6ZAA8_9CLOT|nr:hypothetical protein [Clostridium homopropionicum]KOA19698.1 hypothetical protein CLHOM_17870 [Clostridium homopropionicum DSM 5847]SFF79725.1 hypothetical protein SAMN04488501_102207 [Clostridium homopropionicum]